MKFDVPLMMPAIHSMRFAARPSRSALMIGMPPATEPSNATITPFFCAAAKISLPCVARSALFAVTTCLPRRMASSTRSLATVVPPISSTTISTSLPRTSANASSMTRAFLPTSFLALSIALSATTVMRIARPARRWISSALRFSTSQVPPPTVPMPNSPTLIGFTEKNSPRIFLKTKHQMLPDVRPLGRQHAVHHSIAHRTVAPGPVVPDDAVFFRAERLDRALGAEIEVVGSQPDYAAFKAVEGKFKEQKLARGVDMGPLAALRVPRIADLDPSGGGHDVVIARASYDGVALQVPHGPREHGAFLLFF